MGRQKDFEKAFNEELAKPTTLADRALGVALMAGLFAPLLVGFGLPLLVVFVFHRDHWSLVVCFLALPFALYLLLFGVMGGGFSRVRKNPQAGLRRESAGAKDGEVVLIAGRAAAGPLGPITSELTDQPCLWSELRIETYEHGPRSKGLAEFRVRPRSVAFVVESGEERIDVDPTEGILRSAPHTKEARLHGPGSPHVQKLLAAEGLLEPEAGAAVFESSVREGDSVVVIGVLHRGDAYRGGVRLACGPNDDLVVTGAPLAEVIADTVPNRTLAVIGSVSTAIVLGVLVWNAVVGRL
jgi:hypothetical protein